MKIQVSLIMTMMIFSQFATAQKLKDFKWENRIIVVFAGDPVSDDFSTQVAALESSLPELSERKLLLLKVNGHRITDQYDNSYNATLHEELRKLKNSGEGFEIVLIGLDGGVKLRKTEVVKQSKIFGLIDTMPMRRAEMKNDED